MNQTKKDIYWLPSRMLLILGVWDLLRGVFHTFLLTWSATNIAQFDMLLTPMDQIFMLGVFGISNLLTGVIYLLIALKAREISPYVIIIIPLVYLLGLIGIWSGGVHGQSHFYGRYMMFGYFAVCIITYLVFIIQKRKNS